jgi:hypothetical protein
MARLVAAFRRAFGDSYQEPAVHFHATEQNPEVCYYGDCPRPRLQA